MTEKNGKRKKDWRKKVMGKEKDWIQVYNRNRHLGEMRIRMWPNGLLERKDRLRGVN